MNKFIIIFSLVVSMDTVWAQPAKPPVRLAIIGLVHDHAYGFIPLTRDRADVELVGIVEPDNELAMSYARRFNLNSNLFYSSLEALLAKTKVDAVSAFTSTLDHRRVVEMCAPLHIHVMVEKPLAVNMREARAIEAAAKSGGIQVIVNYETTWSQANQTAYKMAEEEHAIGDLRKIVVHDGHRGPREIGCSETFLKWLTDPELNGGGALTDFGCYGADLITWLMAGQRPTSVFAVTQHIKPEVYPKVEDEATVVLTYPKTQGIIQASWNWPLDRKDMEVYGTTGYLLAPRKDLLRMRKAGSEEREVRLPAPPESGRPQNQLTYLVSVVRGEMEPSGPSCLAINLTVTEILDAARESARTGRRIDLPPVPVQP
ncbi:MAG TPA: Gfo/Idh/MocA family oxidoreductase [Candidatus Cybelea sp.]|jgi:predicted dehydrogenase|nr:Gfo/Idh/MocA family oxidoreductase [Candidatus Cybelea sp.]